MELSALDEYIVEIKKYLNNNSLSETEIIMMIYLDLGMRLRFDQDFFFGGSKLRGEMYRNAIYVRHLNICFKEGKINCRVAAYIIRYVLSNLGVNIKIVVDEYDTRKYPHVYNSIKEQNGREYTIDLQEDMIYIHHHAFTKNFGLSYDSKKYVVPKEEQKKIHEKFGYISKDNPYSDEYLYLLKSSLLMFNNFYDKIDFVLENIEPFDYSNINYFERRWKHQKTLEELFDYKDLESKLSILEFFKENNHVKEYINGFFVRCHSEIIIYFYEDNRYNRYSVSEFALKMKNDEIFCNQKIPGLIRELNKLEEKILTK